MIPYGKQHIDEDDIQAVVNVLRGALVTQGPKVDEFEAAVAAYTGARYAIAVSSGTAALHLAALACGVGPENTLITSPITFVASANAGRYAGANVAFADIDPDTVNMSPQSLAQALATNKNTRAVIPVHFAGLPCDMPAIERLAKEAGAVVIEDAAHALGASYPDGKKVGCCANSLMTIFSFHPVKAIAAGEGGMITTNDETVYRTLLRLRSHGINKLNDPLTYPERSVTGEVSNPWYYEMLELGYHYRITDIQCALALSQMNKLDTFIQRRRRLVEQYDAAFATFKNIKQAQSSGRDRSGHHLYVIRVAFDQIKISRAELMHALRVRGIGTQVHYIPVSAQPYYERLGHHIDDCPNANAYYQQALSIPLYFSLSDDEQAIVINTLKELVG